MTGLCVNEVFTALAERGRGVLQPPSSHATGIYKQPGVFNPWSRIREGCGSCLVVYVCVCLSVCYCSDEVGTHHVNRARIPIEFQLADEGMQGMCRRGADLVYRYVW